MTNFSILEILFILITFSAISSYLNNRFLKFPSAVGITIISMFLVLLLSSVTKTHDVVSFIDFREIEKLINSFNFYNFLVNGILVFLLFASAIKFEISNLKNWWWQISILATIGVVISAIFIGSLIWLAAMTFSNVELPFIYCLLFGAILSPTDPPAAVAVFKSMGGKAPKHIEVKLLGESLFNDGMGIVLFLTILGIINGKELTATSITISLFQELFGAVFLGLLFGYGYKFLLKKMEDFTSIALLTVSLAIGSYVVASHFHFSAPIATVVAGLVIGHNIKKLYNNEQIHHLHLFWDFIDEVLNASLFALIGLVVVFINFSWELLVLGILAFICTLIGRYLAIHTSFFYPNRKGKVLNGSIPIISYGGIRGGISLALALAILQYEFGNYIVGMTFVCVILSNLIQGMTFKHMIQAFYPDDESKNYVGYKKTIQNMFNRLNKQRNNPAFQLPYKEDNEKIIETTENRNLKNADTPELNTKMQESTKQLESQESADTKISTEQKQDQPIKLSELDVHESDEQLELPKSLDSSDSDNKQISVSENTVAFVIEEVQDKTDNF